MQMHRNLPPGHTHTEIKLAQILHTSGPLQEREESPRRSYMHATMERTSKVLLSELRARNERETRNKSESGKDAREVDVEVFLCN